MKHYPVPSWGSVHWRWAGSTWPINPVN